MDESEAVWHWGTVVCLAMLSSVLQGVCASTWMWSCVCACVYLHEFVGLSDVSLTVAVHTQVCVCVFLSVCSVETFAMCGWSVAPWSPFRRRWGFVFLTYSPSEAMFPPPEHSCRDPQLLWPPQRPSLLLFLGRYAFPATTE